MEVCTFYHMDFQLFQNCLLKYDQYDLLLESLQWFPLLLEENPQSFCMICKAFCSCACLVLPSHFVPHAFLSILLQPHWPSGLCEFPKLFSNAVLCAHSCLQPETLFNCVVTCLAWCSPRSILSSLSMAPCPFTLSCFLQLAKNTVIFGLFVHCVDSPWNYTLLEAAFSMSSTVPALIKLTA